MPDANIQMVASDLPEGDPLRRTLHYLQYHGGEDCWCGPTIHRTPAAELVGTAIEQMDGYVPGEDLVFVQHRVLAEEE